MTWPKPMSIVEVEWIDSHSHGGWSTVEQYMDRIHEAGLVCRSAGYLLASEKDRVVVVQNQGLSGNICDAIQIPRSAIKSIRIIDKPQKQREKHNG